MLAPLTRITAATRTAAAGSLSHRIQLEGRNDEFRELADAFDAMLARLEAHVAEQQRFAANASHELRTPLAVTQTLLDVARNDPDRDNGELVDRLHAVNTRAIDLTEALLLLSRADQRAFAREHVDLSLIAEEAAETLLPLAEERGVTIETSGDVAPTVGSHALLLQLTTNLVHNAIVHNLPEEGTVWVTTSVHPETRGAHGREHRREARRRSWSSTLVEPFLRGTDRIRAEARGRRPRPGDRQEHHRGARRNPHPHPPGRRGALRHGATPGRPTALTDARPRRAHPPPGLLVRAGVGQPLPRRSAMPVEAHDRRVVFRRTVGGLEHGMDERLHRFSRMHLRSGLDQRCDVFTALRSVMPSVRNISRSPGSSGRRCTRYSMSRTIPNGASASSAMDATRPSRSRSGSG